MLDEGERWVDVKPKDLPLSALEDRPTVPDAPWLQRKAQELRVTILQMVVRAGGGHGAVREAVEWLLALRDEKAQAYAAVLG